MTFCDALGGGARFPLCTPDDWMRAAAGTPLGWYYTIVPQLFRRDIVGRRVGKTRLDVCDIFFFHFVINFYYLGISIL